jgi:hypothetical protein
MAQTPRDSVLLGEDCLVVPKQYDLLPTGEILELLEAAPGRIDKLTSKVAVARLHAAPEPGEWSANEILAHLRASADVRGSRIETMLREDHPTIRAISPRGYLRKTDYLERAFRLSLGEFTRQRTDLLALLHDLGPNDWSRNATYVRSDKLFEQTIHFEADTIATHEQDHIGQMERAIGG